MTDIEKLKEDKRKAHDKLDEAWATYSPNDLERIQNDEKTKLEFLSLWSDYKNNKIEKEKFLQISVKLAELFHEENEMMKRFEKIIQPLQKEFEKTCEILDKLENKHD